MNIWQILGLEPTGDLAAIKAAYAVQAKRYHPEDHPEEFRTLHDAYRQAVRYAKRHPLAATTPSKPSVPAPLPPSFKPSYHVHGPTDNPRRAPQHRSADDEFSAEQFQEMRRENKRLSPAGAAQAARPARTAARANCRSVAQAPSANRQAACNLICLTGRKSHRRPPPKNRRTKWMFCPPRRRPRPSFRASQYIALVLGGRIPIAVLGTLSAHGFADCTACDYSRLIWRALYPFVRYCAGKTGR